MGERTDPGSGPGADPSADPGANSSADELADAGAQRAADLLHHRAASLLPGDPLAPPLVLAAPYHLPGEADAPYRYGRMSNPTWEACESALSLLEGAPCLLFPSGMAAITAALMALLRSGDTVVLPSDGYYVTRRIVERFLVPLGIRVREHPTADFAQAPMRGAALVFCETPSNPGLEVCDLVAVAAAAHAAGAHLVVDNTTMTPLLQRPLELGADMVVAADTKAPGGHSDLLSGHVATDDAALFERLLEWRTLSGGIAAPFDAWLLHRGLETLEVRLSRMGGNAQCLAERLRERGGDAAARQPRLAVRYPGLDTDPSHALCRRQMLGGGFLIGLTLPDATLAERFLADCALIAQSTSFGGVHTSGERRARWGEDVSDGSIRLSIGCEPLEPLWNAIDASLSAVGC